MIKNYHRPTTLEETLTLLSKPDTIPLGGGTIINSPEFKDKNISVVDLQALGLNHIHKRGHALEIEACVTLQQLLEYEHAPKALKDAIRLEAPLNIRYMGTIAGTLAACDGRSPFAVLMLALDARLTVDGGRKTENGQQSTFHNLGDILPVRIEFLPGKLITKIEIPLHVSLAYEYVARTPADKPIVCAALTQWPSGRTRLALGGWGNSPTLAMDGNEPGGVEDAARNTAHDAADEWASAEYRSDVAAVLAKRCMEAMM